MEKHKLTEKQIRSLKESMQMIILLSDVISLEWHDLAPDFIKTQTGQIKQRCKRIIEDSSMIKKICEQLVYATEDEEHMAYELPYELQRLNRFFSSVEFNQLKAFNDKNETLPKIDYQEYQKQLENENSN